MELATRLKVLARLQVEYAVFDDFLVDAMGFLGFTTTEIQLDIGQFIADEDNGHLMVQAQRGEAKSTITCIYAIWYLIHNPHGRVVVVTSNGKLSTQMATLMTKLIMHWALLECLRPDKAAGDRTSVEAFDLHHSIKGINKSASIATLTIVSAMQGFRADLLIADDIESSKNGLTPTMREYIKNQSRDFPSILDGDDARLIYLGTPQSTDSIYNTLPGEGFNVRIWPGRYPTLEQESGYNGLLAPIIIERMRAHPEWRTGCGINGQLGRPTDPVLKTERKLLDTEAKQGPAYFQLQHMLLTALSDADRYPLNPRNLLFFEHSLDSSPVSFTWHALPPYRLNVSADMTTYLKEAYRPAEVGPVATTCIPSLSMSIDPAGDGGDETAYAIGRAFGGYVQVFDIGGYQHGHSAETLLAIAEKVKEYGVTRVHVEKNMGAGTYTELLKRVFRENDVHCEVIEEWATGQKERRICDTLQTLMHTHKLVFDPKIIDRERIQLQQYPIAQRNNYSVFYQLAKLQRIKGALIHDDRVDALEGLCRPFVESLRADANKLIEEDKANVLKRFLANPTGRPDHSFHKRNNAFRHRRTYVS